MPPDPPAAAGDDDRPADDSPPPGPGEERERIVPVILPAEKEGAPGEPPGVDWMRGAILLLLVLVPLLVYAAWDAGWFAGQAGASPRTSDPGQSERRIARSRFDRMADSLADAIQGYEERRSDFRRDRIGCAGLGTGYDRVDRRFVELSLLYRERKADLDPSRADRYDSLVEQVNEVNRHYDESGCRTGGP